MQMKHHLLSWDQRRTLRERLNARAAALRAPLDETRCDDELAEVLGAIARVDGEDFGRCADCGVPIAWARLMAQPLSRHCLRCASARERGGAAAANF